MTDFTPNEAFLLEQILSDIDQEIPKNYSRSVGTEVVFKFNPVEELEIKSILKKIQLGRKSFHNRSMTKVFCSCGNFREHKETNEVGACCCCGRAWIAGSELCDHYPQPDPLQMVKLGRLFIEAQSGYLSDKPNVHSGQPKSLLNHNFNDRWVAQMLGRKAVWEAHWAVASPVRPGKIF